MVFASVAEERKTICDRRARGTMQPGSRRQIYSGGTVIRPTCRGSSSLFGGHSLGVIPKKHQPGKWRLIVDLSSPSGASVNDFIDPSLCSLTYASVDDAAEFVLRSGRGTLLDIKSAYRNIPVHPGDRHLLGIRWRGRTLVDACLPFGLRSAPKIFNATADALEWMITHQGGARVECIIHYLDDFLFGGSPGTDSCTEALGAALQNSVFPSLARRWSGPRSRSTSWDSSSIPRRWKYGYRKKSCGEYGARSNHGGREEIAQSASFYRRSVHCSTPARWSNVSKVHDRSIEAPSTLGQSFKVECRFSS